MKMNTLCYENSENRIKLSLIVLEILTFEVVRVSPHESMSDLPH